MAETFRFRQLYPLSVVVSNIFFIFTHPEKIWGRWDPVCLIFFHIGVGLKPPSRQPQSPQLPHGYLRYEGSGGLRFLKHGFGWILAGGLGRGRGKLGKPWKCWDQRLGSIDVSGGYNLPNILTSYLLGEITHWFTEISTKHPSRKTARRKFKEEITQNDTIFEAGGTFSKPVCLLSIRKNSGCKWRFF